MQAICAKCGQAATVTVTANGFSFTPDDAMLHCPVVKERMDGEDGRAISMDCDHLQDEVQSLADRLRGTVISQSKT
jgi:hypothetical protein